MLATQHTELPLGADDAGKLHDGGGPLHTRAQRALRALFESGGVAGRVLVGLVFIAIAAAAVLLSGPRKAFALAAVAALGGGTVVEQLRAMPLRRALRAARGEVWREGMMSSSNSGPDHI